MNDEVIIINAFLDSECKVNLAMECVKQLKKTGIEVMMVSHYEIPEKIKPLLDYYLYDKNNVMITEKIDYIFWRNKNIHFRVRNGYAKHSLAALTSLKNGVYFSKSIGKKYFHHIEYDTILSDSDIEKLKSMNSLINDKKGYFDEYKMSYINQGISMLYFYSEIDFFIDNIEIPTDTKKYLNENVRGVCSEFFLYHKLKPIFNDLVIGTRKKFSISIFSDDETKVAVSGECYKNDIGHLSDITYEKNNKEKVMFVFLNFSNNNLKIQIGNSVYNVCKDCIYYRQINLNNNIFEYKVRNNESGVEETFKLNKSEILSTKVSDEFIEFT